MLRMSLTYKCSAASRLSTRSYRTLLAMLAHPMPVRHIPEGPWPDVTWIHLDAVLVDR
jgi:hypothetical protein